MMSRDIRDICQGGRVQSSIGLVLLGIAAAFGGFLVLTLVDIVRGPQVGEHVSARQAPLDLPSDATDVCYVTRPAFGDGMAYEFSIAEESFVAWAKSEGYELKEISEPYRILRYVAYAGDHPGERQATISNGLFYQEQWDPDSGKYAAYDRALNRAYYNVRLR